MEFQPLSYQTQAALCHNDTVKEKFLKCSITLGSTYKSLTTSSSKEKFLKCSKPHGNNYQSMTTSSDKEKQQIL